MSVVQKVRGQSSSKVRGRVNRSEYLQFKKQKYQNIQLRCN